MKHYSYISTELKKDVEILTLFNMEKYFIAVIKLYRTGKMPKVFGIPMMPTLHTTQKTHIVKATSEDEVSTKLKEFYKAKDTDHYRYDISIIDIEEEI